jgi:hypothetical protein
MELDIFYIDKEYANEFKYLYNEFNRNDTCLFFENNGEYILTFHGTKKDINYDIETTTGLIMLADKIYCCYPYYTKKRIKKYVNLECANKVMTKGKQAYTINWYGLNNDSLAFVIGKSQLSYKIFNRKAQKIINNKAKALE